MDKVPTSVKYGVIGGVAGYAAYNYLDQNHQLGADIQLARKVAPFRQQTEQLRKANKSLVDVWHETVKQHPDKAAIVFIEPDASAGASAGAGTGTSKNKNKSKTRSVTFREMDDQSNQVARWLTEGSPKLKKGDTLALFMSNKPEFVISWLGAAKVGVLVALVNTSIKSKPLFHSIKISAAKAVLFSSDLADQMRTVKDQLVNELGIVCFSEDKPVDFCEYAGEAIHSQSTKPIDPNARAGIGYLDKFGYIYTSGTTGLPKAANIPHSKLCTFGFSIPAAFEVRKNDVIYTCLPLFHSAGGGLGAGMMVCNGNTMVLREKFSATNFFKDCTENDVTAVQYIGEMCRFLLQTPESSYDRAHKVRVAIGNGLRPEIWNEFQERFNIPEIGEFYGATEGNGALFNHCKSKDEQGACGCMGSLAMAVLGARLVKFDVDEEAPVRDSNGFCKDVEVNEAGELLFPIKPNDPATNFNGYNDKEATEKKILRDAFKKGDMYFRTGDLLRRDEKSFFFFVDRIGDTFRWKGENCSTSEVSQEISVFPGVEECNVVGVQIPNNHDGRAPLAAITPKDGDMSNLDLTQLAQHAKANLPSYAVPLFIRIVPQAAVTATMKHQKVDLRKEGIDISVVKDPLYVLSNKGSGYELLTPEKYKEITSPRARL